jgi:alkylation response protein AidB-like acyl-CoA dehydrogenase
MGGLMITEPDYGSDALNMKTQNKLEGEKYHIKGTKHWQGLTGMGLLVGNVQKYECRRSTCKRC